MGDFTVNDLLKACKEQVKEGNGNKKILVAGDEEGNFFNPLYYLFTSSPDLVKSSLVCSNSDYDNPEEYVLLG